jgi:hypothetical protein
MMDRSVTRQLADLHRVLTLQGPQPRPRGLPTAGWKPRPEGNRMGSLAGAAGRMGSRMSSLLPGWNSIEGSAKWGDVFFWTGFACLVLLAGSIVLSKVYSWRKDALVAMRDQLIAIAADARIEQQRREIEAELERTQAEPQEHHDAGPAVVARAAPAAPAAPLTPAPPAHEAAPARAAPPPAETAVEPQSEPPPLREPERIARLTERSPRSLSEGQKRSIVGLTSAYRGQRFTVVCIAGDAEGRSLADAIVGVLRSAGWEFPENAVAEATYSKEPTGVSVIVNSGQVVTPGVLRPTSNLVKALADAGLMPRDGALSDPNVPRDRIEIRVGRNRAPS